LKTKNVRIRQARKYMHQLQKWEKNLLPKELHKASVLDQYEYLWEKYYQHGSECFMPVPWSVIRRLQRRNGQMLWW
jgi:hypothetical protein